MLYCITNIELSRCVKIKTVSIYKVKGDKTFIVVNTNDKRIQTRTDWKKMAGKMAGKKRI